MAGRFRQNDERRATREGVLMEENKTMGIAAATAFLARFGGEGTYDTNRDAKMTAQVVPLKSSDVGFKVRDVRHSGGAGQRRMCGGTGAPGHRWRAHGPGWDLRLFPGTLGPFPGGRR
jgi:hypothetical protein